MMSACRYKRYSGNIFQGKYYKFSDLSHTGHVCESVFGVVVASKTAEN